MILCESIILKGRQGEDTTRVPTEMAHIFWAGRLSIKKIELVLGDMSSYSGKESAT